MRTIRQNNQIKRPRVGDLNSPISFLNNNKKRERRISVNEKDPPFTRLN